MDSPAAALTASRESGDLAGLLHAVAGGDRAALADLYARTSAKLYGICLRLLGSEAEADEVLQETYVAVWRRARSYDAAKASAVTWLAVVARNKAIDRLRVRRPASAPIEAATEIADETPSAIDLLEAAEDRERLAACLDELEEKQRGLIRTAFLDGASYPELAEREAVPLGTMKSWIRRSLMRLRGCLER
ncbi:MAG: sigma-70 family RNA polymerase sigma factor [Alphaproteobacteria bacterium]|nr:sigma-70 family RNA polymerase sigma factor [Alphaproteobacteria bacterium]MBV9370850.1 sigma-70 family RNA polymerase sigma factor [Alphaproteobacteria bacterium]MBV9901281.1 sigma-70 family RNA polymerase sigma factor [Alphaproteobacteria bacterium]